MKAVLSYGDMHCGSLLGLWPPGVKKEHGGGTTRNKYQLAMWKIWNHLLTKRLPERWPDGFAVAVNGGDTIEGMQEAEKGISLEVANPTIQCDAAIKAQEPLRDMIQDWYFLQGTPYHEKNDYLSGEHIAGKLGGVENEHGGHTFYELPLTVNGINFHFKHSIPYYEVHRTTAIVKELKYALTKEAEQLMGEMDVIARFHVHTSTGVWFMVGEKRKEAFTHPCFKVEGKWITQRYRFRPIAHFGMIVTEVYGPDHDPPFRVIPLTYPVRIRRLKKYHA